MARKPKHIEAAEPELSGKTLANFVMQVEKFEYEKSLVAEKIKGVLAAAKSEGFDPKTIRQLIRDRRRRATRRCA